jgi:histidinol-phosphate aminotransferase
MNLTIPDFISAIKPYEPGKPLEELEREYGIRDSIKLASNENPLGPSPMAIKAVEAALSNLHRYPDGSSHFLIRKLSQKLHIAADRIVPGSGSDDVIGMLSRALLVPGDEAIIPNPAFLMYEIMIRTCGAVPIAVPLKSLDIDLAGMAERITARTRIVFLTQPNNPTGKAIRSEDFERFLAKVPPRVVVVVDEAYIEFMRDEKGLNGIDYIDSENEVVVLRTFSKAYGLAGLRVGYGLMGKNLAGLLHRVRQPFNVNSLAQVAATAALDDEAFLRHTVETVHNGLDYLYGELDRLGVEYVQTETNFFLINVQQDANSVFERFLRQGIIVRAMASYGFPNHIRVTVGTPAENERFIKTLVPVLQG